MPWHSKPACMELNSHLGSVCSVSHYALHFPPIHSLVTHKMPVKCFWGWFYTLLLFLLEGNACFEIWIYMYQQIWKYHEWFALPTLKDCFLKKTLWSSWTSFNWATWSSKSPGWSLEYVWITWAACTWYLGRKSKKCDWIHHLFIFLLIISSFMNQDALKQYWTDKLSAIAYCL